MFNTNRNILNSAMVGLDDVLHALAGSDGKYPFYDIYYSKNGDDNRIEVAVAGFSESELQVYKDGELLVIEGNKEADNSTAFFRSIAKRSFKRSFMLGSNVEVSGVDLKYGILSVSLKKVQKEDSKKLIPINTYGSGAD